MTERITDPDAIDFTQWSTLAAAISHLEPDLQFDAIEDAGLDPVAFREAELIHLREMGRRVSRGDRSLAVRHASNLDSAREGRLASNAGGAADALATTIEGAAPKQSDLPFSTTRSPEFEAELRDLREKLGPSSSAGATLDPGQKRPDDTLPFGPQRDVDLLQVDSYARFCAEVEAAGDRRAVERRFGVDEGRAASLDRYWSRRFATEPYLRDQFEVLRSRFARERNEA